MFRSRAQGNVDRPDACVAQRITQKSRRQWAEGSYGFPLGQVVTTPTIYLLPFAYCLLPTAYRLLPAAYRLLPSAYCFPPSAFCLPPTAFRLPPLSQGLAPLSLSPQHQLEHLPTRIARHRFLPHS